MNELATRLEAPERTLAERDARIERLQVSHQNLRAASATTGAHARAAAARGDVAALEDLLSPPRGLHAANSEDDELKTPLILATLGHHVDAVKVLMRLGARAAPQGNFQHTPLRAAALVGNEAITRLLLVSGADPNARSGATLWPSSSS